MLLPIKKIICPTDFSEPSYEGLKAAEELALNFDAELVLIHVVSPINVPVNSLPSGDQYTMLIQEIEAASQQKIDQIAKERISREVKSRNIVILGNAADEITRIAESENADIIVIATHGWTGLV